MENVEEVLPLEARERIRQGYTLVHLKPGERASVTKGQSYFGSGGYVANYLVLTGEVKVLSKKHWDNGFVSATDYTITACVVPTVVVASASDAISRTGRRYFQREIIVWR